MGSCISCKVHASNPSVKRAVIAVFVLVVVTVAAWMIYPFCKGFVGAVKGLVDMHHSENPTALANSYANSLKTSASIVDGSNLTVACRIANVGNRSIKQLMIQINLLDNDGKIIAWIQGPLIRKYQGEERGLIIKAAYSEQILNSFSKFEAPFRPGRRISFQHSFSDVHDKSNASSAGIQVMDIEFTDR
jgi:hypothetical protein